MEWQKYQEWGWIGFFNTFIFLWRPKVFEDSSEWRSSEHKNCSKLIMNIQTTQNENASNIEKTIL